MEQKKKEKHKLRLQSKIERMTKELRDIEQIIKYKLPSEHDKHDVIKTTDTLHSKLINLLDNIMHL